MARFRSGHHKLLNSYKHRLNEEEDPRCRHCVTLPETTEHLLVCRSVTARRLRRRFFGAEGPLQLTVICEVELEKECHSYLTELTAGP